MNQDNRKNWGRIQALDYLKAFAVILVILTHALTKAQRLKIAGPFWISMAVPIFMIVSGFTNTLTAEKENFYRLKDFFMKRELFYQLSKILRPYLILNNSYF